jgi:hypothetical protein
MNKKCQHCKTDKPLAEFFGASFDGRSHEVGTSTFCKQCHADGKIQHGYGWYGDKFRTPEDMK